MIFLTVYTETMIMSEESKSFGHILNYKLGLINR